MHRFRLLVPILSLGLVLLWAATTSSIHAGFSTGPDWSVESNQGGALMGQDVSSAGDVNGDGYDDVVVTANRYDNGEFNEGRVWLFLGSPSGLATTAAWTFESDQSGAEITVAGTAGDVNRDGFDDVIVGAPRYNNGNTNEGKAWVFLGSSSGLDATPAWSAVGGQAGAFFGVSVSGVGDVNGDGYDDVHVGAHGYTLTLANEGAAFVYHGSAAGLSPAPNWAAYGRQTGALFGRGGPAGDVNGDGLSDLIIGSGAYDSPRQDAGRAWIYAGSPVGLQGFPLAILQTGKRREFFANSVASAGDVNNDGFSDVLANGTPGSKEKVYLYLGSASGPDNDPDVVLEGEVRRYRGELLSTFFGDALGTAGDINRDGFDDVVIGARVYGDVNMRWGRVYIFAGSPAGLDPDPVRVVDGEQDNENLGVSVAAAGDVNGDAFPDVIAGAFTWSNPQYQEGRAVAFHGSAGF